MRVPHFHQGVYGARIASLLAAGVMAGLLGSACVPEAERAALHRERAEQFLLEDRNREALFEFYQAASLQPDDADLHLRVAEVSTELGFYSDAAEFYREALALRPDEVEISLRLASLLVHIDPAAAQKIGDELLETDPRNARAWLLRAELALAENDTEAAKAHVGQARHIAPQEPEVEWTLALVEEAVGRMARIRNPLAAESPRHWRGIVSAYDRYLSKGGERRLLAALRRAHGLSQIPDRKDQALDAYRDLLDQTRSSDSRAEKITAFGRAYGFASRVQDPGLAQQAVTLWTELAPEDLAAWQHQARLYAKAPPAEQDAAYRRMLDDSGSNPAVQIVYAEYLAEKKGLETGLDHLRGRLKKAPDDAALLSGIADLQQRNGRLGDSARTLAGFQQRFPDDTVLQLLMARQALLKEDYDRAEAIIGNVPQHSRSALTYQILAQAQMQRHRDKEALEAIKTAIALAREVDPASLRLKAQIHLNLREHRKAASTLIRLWRNTSLSPREEILLAGAYYDSRAPGVGRKILARMIDRDPANSVVALELYRREAPNPARLDFLVEILERVLELNPENTKTLMALTRLDLGAGQADRALARVEAVIDRGNWVGYPYLARARIYLSTGRLKLAVDDAKRARLLAREISEESFEVQALAYLASSDPSRPIAVLEKSARAGNLSADRLALLARLQLHSGSPQRALELYEHALAAGSRLNHVKNDLALLLAESETDLERAEALALSAIEAPGEQINAIDTLGFVYLKQGQANAAYWKFRYAIANAETPNADYHYHLALALLAMQRNAEAREALGAALDIDPSFEPARVLQATLSAGHSASADESSEAS